MTRVVTVLFRAQADVEAIHAWISVKSPAGANAWYTAFQTAAASLSENAERCGVAPESSSLEPEVRERLFRTRRGRAYRLLFTIVDNEVRILRVRGFGQSPLKATDLIV